MDNIDITKEFENLVCALSPENLAHDGERSQAQINKAQKQIMARWHDLERELGRTVTEDEVWDWIINEK
jgi:hypothetical protein